MESPEGDTLPRPPPDAGDKGLRGGAAQERPTALPREGAGKGGTEGGDAEVENARRASPRAGTEDTGMHHRVVRRYIQMEPDTTATLWWGLLHSPVSQERQGVEGWALPTLDFQQGSEVRVSRMTDHPRTQGP